MRQYLLLILLLLCGCRRPQATAIRIYTNPGATTPVLPLYAVDREHRLPELPPFEYRFWTSTVAFQSLLFAGDGTLWVGHLEGFARARHRGAHLQLLAVTGWRKWQILTRTGKTHFPADFANAEIPYGPPGASGKDVLEDILRKHGVRMAFQPQEIRALLLKILDRKIDTAIVPEPFASLLLDKDPSLKCVSSVEQVYADYTGRPAQLPWAGIAVNSDWAAQHPEWTARLLETLASEGRTLAALPPEQAARYWPADQNHTDISAEALQKSLARDLILVTPARDCQVEIREFLGITAPEIPFNPELIWKP